MYSIILAHGDYTGLIFLALLLVAAIVVGCLVVIVGSLWLTSKLGGSMDFVRGALLGVATVYILPVSVLWGAGLPFLNGHVWHERMLPEAAEAMVLSCLVSVTFLRQKRGHSEQCPPTATN